jgi:hypothetical protein
MSILQYLPEYTKEYMPPSVAWRERRIWHVTKSGARHFVKIKSLPPEEQIKYKPIELINKDKRAEKLNKRLKSSAAVKPVASASQQTQQLPPEQPKQEVEGEVFDFYFGIKNPSKYDKLEEGELVEATLDSSKAIDMEDDEGLHIVFARNVPIDAVKEYLDEEGNWKKIDIDDKDKKAEFIKFSDNDFFKLDLYKYKDLVNLELQTDDEEPKIKKETISKYEKYIIETKLSYLYKSKLMSIRENEYAEDIDPKYVQMAKDIAKQLNIEFRGFIPMKELTFLSKKDQEQYINTAIFQDDIITGTSFLVQILGTYNEVLNKVKLKFEEKKKEFGK